MYARTPTRTPGRDAVLLGDRERGRADGEGKDGAAARDCRLARRRGLGTTRGASVRIQPEASTGTATATQQAWPTHSQEAFGDGASCSPWWCASTWAPTGDCISQSCGIGVAVKPTQKTASHVSSKPGSRCRRMIHGG